MHAYDPEMSTRIEPGSIVVAVDGSEHAESALGWAAEQAALERRPLVVVTASDGSDASAIGWSGVHASEGEITRRVVAKAQETADEAADLARRLHPGVSVESVAVRGDARLVLAELSGDAHLLVLGSRGRGPLRSALLGSVSASLVKRADCPLVVCRPRGSARAEEGIIVGADGSGESLPVLEFAFRQASLRGLPLIVVHSYWDAVATVAGLRRGAELPEAQDVEELRTGVSQSIAGLTEKYPDVPVSVRITHGLVDVALTPSRQAWSLVVVGRHPMDSVGRFLTGPVATAVLERSRCHVAVVPQE